MSLILEHGNIVDRVKEVQKIEKIIDDTAKARVSHAIVLWADSGYGKSAIMRKIKKSFNTDNTHVIIVETPPTNTTTPIEGQYLNYIAEAIDCDMTMTKQLSLSTFLGSSQNNIQSMIDMDSILQGGHSLQSAMVARLGQISFTDLKSQRLLYDNSTDSLLVIKDYIEAVIRSTNVVLDITNAQNIDATSFRIINSILQNNSNIVVVFEYTTKDSCYHNVHRFAAQLYCPCTTIEVDKLPFDFALSIIGIPNNLNKIYEIEKFYNEVVKGNLYKIIQAKSDDAYSFPCEEDPIERKIQSLGYASKLLLVVICLHDGKIETSTFNDVLQFINESFYISNDWRKELNTLITQEDNNIKLRHASITDALQLSIDNAVVASAYHYLTAFYEKINASYTDRINKDIAVVELVKLHSRFDPIRMLPLLDEFKQVVIEKLSEHDAYILIKQAFDALGDKNETEFHYKLIALCYEAGFYKGALDLLNSLKHINTECGQVYRCMLLNRNDYHRETISQCNKLLKSVKNIRYKMIVLMIRMLSERSLGLNAEYIKTFKTIEKNQKFKDLLEYGFLLRNSQIVLSYNESIPYLKQSIEFFEKQNEHKYAVYSRLTYLIQCARLGHLKHSYEMLEEIAPLLINSSFEKHIVYLNLASIRLLYGIADDITMRMLDKALITATTVFDRVVILNDILCALIVKGKPSNEFEGLMNKLVSESNKEPDLQLRRKSYTNIFLYYRMIGNEEQALYWRKIARSIKLSKTKQTIESVFIFDEEPDENLRFLASRHYCVCFITYWHFDIPLLDF